MLAIEVRYRSDSMSRAILDKLVYCHTQNGFVVGNVSEPCPVAIEAIYSNDLGGHESPESERVQPTGKFFLVDCFASELTNV